VELFIVLIIKLAQCRNLVCLDAIARSSIALACFAVPSCSAPTNVGLNARTKTANAVRSDFPFMAFPLPPKRRCCGSPLSEQN
jgi:hypothetical protein